MQGQYKAVRKLKMKQYAAQGEGGLHPYTCKTVFLEIEENDLH